jgi:hypothetical protein
MTVRCLSLLLLAGLALPARAHLIGVVLDKPAAAKPQADPAATKLLADARAARAGWEKFPGFRARLEINIDGKTVEGRVEVSPKGKVTIQVPEAEAQREAVGWAQQQLASLAAHRLDNSAELDTPCAFLDETKDHPLGRAIRVLNDEFHSSYRVRDRQIIVVNRHMADSRFTITVMENRLNEEKKYLPVCYVVNTWDLKTEALKSSATHHHTWERVGRFDLPVSLTVVTARTAGPGGRPEGKLEARSLKLSGHELLP